MLDSIVKNSDLNDALKNYRNSSTNNPEYESKKDALEKLLDSPIDEIESPNDKLNALVEDLISNYKNIHAQGESEIGLVDSLIKLDKDQFSSWNQNNNTKGMFDKYNSLDKDLNDKNYFDIIKKAIQNNNKVPNKIYEQIKSINDSDASNVIKSVLKGYLDSLETSNDYWWKHWGWYVILTIGSLSVISLVYTSIKKFLKTKFNK